MLKVLTGLNYLQTNKIPSKGGKIMLTNVLTIVRPGDPLGAAGENPGWPLCSCPVFAVFNWLF